LNFRTERLNFEKRSKKGIMKKLLLLLGIILIAQDCLKGQTYFEEKVIAFHPSAGNEIDLREKQEFNIFTEYSDSLFESAQLIIYGKGSYSIRIKAINGKTFEKPADTTELDSIYASIERVKPLLAVKDAAIKAHEEKRKREERAETARIIADVTCRSIIIVIQVLGAIAQAY
jgi:hypothetical protein